MLASLTDLKTQIGASGTTDDTQLQSCLTAADRAVKAYCRCDFEAASRVEYLDGPGTPELVLPWAWRPVNTITEVRLDLNGGRGQKADTFGTDTVLELGTDYTYDTATGILRRERVTVQTWLGWPGYGVGPSVQWAGLSTYGGPAAHRPRLAGCVKVTASTGYATAGQVPADLRAAVIQLAAWLFLIEPNGGLVPTSQSYIDVSQTLTWPQAELIGNLTVPALGTVRQLLAAYREPVIAGGVR